MYQTSQYGCSVFLKLHCKDYPFWLWSFGLFFKGQLTSHAWVCSVFSLFSLIDAYGCSLICMYAWPCQAILSSSVILPPLFFLLIISLTLHISLWFHVNYTDSLSVSMISGKRSLELIECFRYYGQLKTDCSNPGRQNIFLLKFLFFKLIHWCFTFSLKRSFTSLVKCSHCKRIVPLISLFFHLSNKFNFKR